MRSVVVQGNTCGLCEDRADCVSAFRTCAWIHLARCRGARIRFFLTNPATRTRRPSAAPPTDATASVRYNDTPQTCRGRHGGAEDEAEEGPFEIRDFSVASPWEELISTVEEAVRAWLRGAADRARSTRWHGRRELLLSCHGEPDERQSASADGALPQFMSEMLDARADFRAGEAFSKDSVERLRRWFGLQTFVLLQPATPESLDASEMALLQGTLNVALLNCGCAVPGFVSHEPARGGFCGRASGDGGAAYASLP